MTRDPLGFATRNPNLYQYAGGRPVADIDASGLQNRGGPPVCQGGHTNLLACCTAFNNTFPTIFAMWQRPPPGDFGKVRDKTCELLDKYLKPPGFGWSCIVLLMPLMDQLCATFEWYRKNCPKKKDNGDIWKCIDAWAQGCGPEPQRFPPEKRCDLARPRRRAECDPAPGEIVTAAR